MVVSEEQKECICVGEHQSKLLSEYLDFLFKHRGISENTVRFRRNVPVLLKRKLAPIRSATQRLCICSSRGLISL